MKTKNLEQFLQDRGLNYKVVVGPRWNSNEVKGKPSEDRFYIINSSLEEIKTVRSVWVKGKFSTSVDKALKEFDLHETGIMYTHDFQEVRKTIFAEGEKAYNVYMLRDDRKGEEKMDKMSKNFEKMIKKLK